MSSTRSLDPDLWSWKKLSSSSNHLSRYERLALSSECMWASRPKAAHDIFVFASLTLKTPIPRCNLHVAARSAWRLLLFNVPDLAVKAECRSDGRVRLVYELPEDGEFEKRVERSYVFESAEGELLAFDVLRERVVTRRGERDEDKAVLLVQAEVGDGEEELVEHFQLMLYVDHLVTDGIGIRVLLSKYLTLLASTLATQPLTNQPLNWSSTPSLLSPPWLSLLPSPPLTNPETTSTNRTILKDKINEGLGLPLTHPFPLSTQETCHLTLSTSLTTSLLLTIHNLSTPTPKKTITHLLHASLLLSLLHYTPSPPFPPQTLYAPCWLNGRKYLFPPHHQDYIPLCLGFAPLIINNLSSFTPVPKTGSAQMKEKVLELTDLIAAEYSKIQEEGVGNIVNFIELTSEFGDTMRKKSQERDNGIVENEMGERGCVQPFLLSDGITENYISHTYTAKTKGAGKDQKGSLGLGEQSIEVEDVCFAAAAEENLIVRLSTWRNQLRIAGEWRGCDYERCFIVGFLEDVVGVMVSVVEGQGEGIDINN